MGYTSYYPKKKKKRGNPKEMTEAGLVGRQASEGPLKEDNKPNGAKEGELKTRKKKGKEKQQERIQRCRFINPVNSPLFL